MVICQLLAEISAKMCTVVGGLKVTRSIENHFDIVYMPYTSPKKIMAYAMLRPTDNSSSVLLVINCHYLEFTSLYLP